MPGAAMRPKIGPLTIVCFPLSHSKTFTLAQNRRIPGSCLSDTESSWNMVKVLITVNCMLGSYLWRVRTWGRGDQTALWEWKINFFTLSAIFIVLLSQDQRWKPCFADLLSLRSPFSCSLKWKRLTNKKICPLVDLAQLQSSAGQE